MISKHFVANIVKLVRALFLLTVKWFQILLSNTNDSIYYLTLCQHLVKWSQVLIFKTNSVQLYL